jgi:hypothetical protein
MMIVTVALHAAALCIVCRTRNSPARAAADAFMAALYKFCIACGFASCLVAYAVTFSQACC